MKKMFGVLILGTLTILLSMNASYTYGMDENGTEDYTTQISEFKKAGFFRDIHNRSVLQLHGHSIWN